MRKSSIWYLTLISPLLSGLLSFTSESDGPEPWLELFSIMNMAHSLLFLPLLTGIFAAFICRFEHLDGGWKQLLALPVSRSNVYVAKFLIVVLLLTAVQLLYLAVFLLAGWIQGLPGAVPFDHILISLGGSLAACLPLAALQMLVSVSWQSFGAPMALNVIFTLPNILVANSDKFGPYYPWAQPFLAAYAMPGSSEWLNFSAATLYLVIIGGFVLFFGAGMIIFRRKEL